VPTYVVVRVREQDGPRALNKVVELPRQLSPSLHTFALALSSTVDSPPLRYKTLTRIRPAEVSASKSGAVSPKRRAILSTDVF
jgi:hypothetical protein